MKLETVLVHGRRGYVFAIPNDQEHGSNMTVTVLNRVLIDLFHPKPESGRMPDCPKNLWLQLDNCSGENKNHVVLAYCALLLLHGTFETVGWDGYPLGKFNSTYASDHCRVSSRGPYARGCRWLPCRALKVAER